MTEWAGYYEADIEPYVIEMPTIGAPYPQIFLVSEDLPFPTTDQIIRATRAGCQIDLGVSPTSGLTFDLATISEAIPHITGLRITCAASVTGWAELSRAASLTSFLLGDEEPPEVLRLADLPQLTNAGVLGLSCLSVCDNPSLKYWHVSVPLSVNRYSGTQEWIVRRGAITHQVMRPW